MINMTAFSRACRSRRGASAFTYGILVGLVAVAALVAVSGVGGSVSGLLGGAGFSMEGVTNTAPAYGGGPVSVPLLAQEQAMTPVDVGGFSDADGDEIGFSAEGSWPPGLSVSKLSETTARIEGTPTAYGSFSGLSIRAADAHGSVATPQFTIEVDPANHPPAYGGPAVSVPSLALGVAMSDYDVTGFSDPESDSVTFSQGGTWPPGLGLTKISDSTVRISGTPTAPGTFAGLTIIADDGEFSGATGSFGITVVPPPADHGWGWGSNGGSGYLGAGLASPDQVSPVAVNTAGALPDTWLQVVPAGAHSCGIDTGNVAWCWGSGGGGRLGNSTNSAAQTSPFPVNTAGGLPDTYTYISAGNSHTCAVAGGGALWCWGRDTDGALGDGALTATNGNALDPSPVDVSALPPGTTWSKVAAGYVHTCGITSSGAAYCWGQDGAGDLGDGALTTGSDVPSPVDTGGGRPATYTDIAVGYRSDTNNTTCAIATGGAAWCWGGNGGRLGTGVGTTSTVPVAVTGGFTWTFISVGQDHSCGVTTGGIGYCWGSDGSGSLGNGTVLTATQLSPSPVDTGPGLPATWLSITAGNNYSCGVASDRSGWCWGQDGSGAQGNGATVTAAQPSPYPVDTTGGRPVEWKSIIAGFSPSPHTMAISD
jgi:Flp pilus assembly pilin Flp